MKLKAFLLLPFGLILASAQDPNYSGTWMLGGQTTEILIEQTGDTIHVKEQHDGKLRTEYTCNTAGKDCDFKEEGKKAKVSVYFNGPKMVEIRTRGDVIVKRRFDFKPDGTTLAVETMPITPAGKSETTLYARK